MKTYWIYRKIGRNSVTYLVKLTSDPKLEFIGHTNAKNRKLAVDSVAKVTNDIYKATEGFPINQLRF